MPDGRVEVQQYWHLAEVAAEAAELVHQSTWLRVLERSIAAHLVADVPVSSFLSGGLDSSIVTVLAKTANPDIDAYTIRFRQRDQLLEAMPDDAVYARKVALSSASTFTRSRSPRRSWTSCLASSPFLTNRLATRQPSIRCSCARRLAGGREGTPFRDGSGRTFRWLSQAPRLLVGCPVSAIAAALRRSSHGSVDQFP